MGVLQSPSGGYYAECDGCEMLAWKLDGRALTPNDAEVAARCQGWEEAPELFESQAVTRGWGPALLCPHCLRCHDLTDPAETLDVSALEI